MASEETSNFTQSKSTRNAVDLPLTVTEKTSGPMSAVIQDQREFSSPLTVGAGRHVKRCIDICVSLPVVILLLPPAALLTWLAHRLQSPGPLFFRQERCGLSKRRFTILKFRTMNVDGGDTSANDSKDRIFPIGNLLRKTKVDEIPQFVNTLLGTMSIVGPRPHHFADCEAFEKEVEEYSLRTVAKPGITGLAQYKEYRGDFEWNCVDNRVQRDLAYIREWSVMMDLRLMVKTANVIRRKCWYAVLRKVERSRPRLGVFLPSEQTHPETADVHVSTGETSPVDGGDGNDQRKAA